MAIAVVQTANNGGTLPISFGSNVTAGNTVFLIVGMVNNAPGTVSNPTLGGSSVAGSVALFNPGTTKYIAGNANTNITAWMMPNCPGGSANLNLSISGTPTIPGVIAIEVSGLGSSPALDKSSSGFGNSTAVDSGASGATTGFPEFILGLGQVYAGSGAGPGGWTNINAGGTGFTWAGYQIASSTGSSYDWQQTGNSAQNWAAGAATIKPPYAHSRSAALTVTPTFSAAGHGPLRYVNLTLDLYDGGGNAISSGLALFTPSVPVSSAGTEVVSTTPVMASFRPGLPTVVKLLATDNAALSPSGWTWQVQFQGIPGALAPFSFTLPYANGASANQSLSSLVATPAVIPTQSYLPLPSGTPAAGMVPVATGSGQASAWRAVTASGSGGGAGPVPVMITCNGASFSPSVTLAPGSSAIVTWIKPDGSTVTGLTPTISLPSGTNLVRMTATDPYGNNALNQIQTFNIGYNSTLDGSPYSLDSSYNWPSQSVSGIGNVNAMTGLVNFLAEQIPGLTGTLDFSGLAWLQHIDCFGSGVQGVNIVGCQSLIRLDVEQNKMTALNLNQIAPYLYDLRFANQQGGAITFANQAVSLVNLYHFCVRDQVITNMPNFVSWMPHINQLWIWHTGQSGTLQTASDSLTSLQAYSNSYTSANLANQFVTGTGGYLDLNNNSLTSCTLTGCTSLLFVDLHNNLLPQAQVDGVLAVLAGTSISNGTVNVGGTGNAAPSAAGLASSATLTGRGWTVTHN